MAADW